MADRMIVIGAGLAGLVAAWAASRQGASVLILDRGGLGLGTNSAIANGYFAGPGSSYAPEKYFNDIRRIGKELNVPGMVRLAAERASETISELEELGFGLLQYPEHYIYDTSQQDVVRGAPMMRDLAALVKALPGVSFKGGFRVSRLLIASDGVEGVAGWDRRGRQLEIGAGAVVLAGGGAGAIYLCNDNQKRALGQGYHLALQAGLSLWDLEFVQFYPFVMVQRGAPSMMLYPPYPPQTRLLNQEGDDILAGLGFSDLNQAIQKLRDQVAIALYEQVQKGEVFMDFTAAEEEYWQKYPLLPLTRMRFDFRRQPVSVSPGAHFFMGGVRIDEQGQTSLPGLFACGETVWGLHGANRRGGNALLECLVFGRLAGRSAGRQSLAAGEPPFDQRESKLELPGKSQSPPRGLRDLLTSLRKVAWQRAGVKRSQQGLEQGLAELTGIRARIADLKPGSPAELELASDLKAAGLVLGGILSASLARQESRGAFLRADYPERDDENWLRNSRLRYDPEKDEFSLEHHPVPEDWPRI